MSDSISRHKETAGLVSLMTGSLICRTTRETLRKRIAEHAIEPAGQDGAGNDLYWIVDLAIATHGGRAGKKKGGEVVDPMKLPATERNAWFQSEQKRLDLEERAGRLVPLDDVRREYSALCMDIAKYLETLPDELERDASMTPEQVDVLHESVRRSRQRLYDEIQRTRVESDADAAAALAKLG